MRNSRIRAWREISTPEEWGILSAGPASCRMLTVKSTLFCSEAVKLSHHSPNSSENSTSHATIYYVIGGIMSSMTWSSMAIWTEVLAVEALRSLPLRADRRLPGNWAQTVLHRRTGLVEIEWCLGASVC